MDRKRAQASLEYAAVVAMLLAASIPIWMFVQGKIDSSRYELDSTISQEAADRVASAADWAYLSGYPARRIVEVTLPPSLVSFSFDGREARVNFTAPGGYSEAYATSLANLSGTAISGGGNVKLAVGANEGIPGNVVVSAVS